MNRYQAPGASDQPVWDVWLSSFWLPSLTAAEEVGLFRELEATPASPAELAARMGLDDRGVTALVRMLASIGFLVPRGGAFHLTDVGRTFLLERGTFFMGSVLRLGLNTQLHDRLIAALRRKPEPAGPDGRPLVGGSGLPVDDWARGAITLERARQVARIMHAHSLAPAIGLAASGIFDGVQRLLDVGGGSGCFSIAIAQRYPDVRCTIMDLAAMCEAALEYVAEGGVTGRVGAASVDMFRQEWPADHDAILLSNVLHDWTFQTARFLVKRAFDALPTGGRLHVHELLIDDDEAGPATAAAFSLMMLLTTQGQQFTFLELAGLLERAGFAEVRVRATHGYYSVVSGRKP